MTFNDWASLDDALEIIPRGSAAWEILRDCRESRTTPESLREEIVDLREEMSDVERELADVKRWGE